MAMDAAGKSGRSHTSDTSSRYTFPVALDALSLKRMVEDAVDWAHGHGMVMRTPQHKDRSDVCQTAPFTLLPSPFPRRIFQQAVDIQQATNLLYFRISWDYDFLIKSHADVVKTDDFTRHFVEILKRVHEAGVKQRKTLLIQRADYMCDDRGDGEFRLRQVEVNNIAASMGWLSEMASRLHRRVLQDLNVPDDVIANALPQNRAIDTVAEGIYDAWLDFGDQSALILFVVEEVNQNQLDQRHVEYRIDQLSSRRAKCIRLTLTQCAERLSLGGASGYDLMYDARRRICIVYFRAGYLPDNYCSEREWNARLTMELSNAIKCPWIGLQLANTKKVQQVLACDGQLERFLPERTADCDRVRATFAGLWGLENDDVQTQAIIKEAIEHPEQFVLKPQLEGGGGNYYGEEVAQKLREMSHDERAAHILMERIQPMHVKNYLVRPFEDVSMGEVVGELGIYGCLYAEPALDAGNEKILKNVSHGHIIRSKAENVDKGGVAIGAAVIDSPFLF
ncbi:Glutathione synthetase [Toxocara canis]|uniref:Glutathione synthetase n=1 Tax=Toxocara canis TaxID=6265 RepID=A0A0B2W072_TOXCA|nr:Glutathione synthetase [Toxocara canis]